MISIQWLILLLLFVVPYHMIHDKSKNTLVIKAVSWQLETSRTKKSFELRILQFFKALLDYYAEMKSKGSSKS